MDPDGIGLLENAPVFQTYLQAFAAKPWNSVIAEPAAGLLSPAQCDESSLRSSSGDWSPRYQNEHFAVVPAQLRQHRPETSQCYRPVAWGLHFGNKD